MQNCVLTDTKSYEGFKEDQEFRELIVTPIFKYNETFAKPGDSGSFVCDINGKLIGIVFAGYKDNINKEVVIIPIHRILDLMKRKIISLYKP